MKIAAVCLTYCRPQLIGQIIECFLRQDYLDSELVILDDAGQYRTQDGDRWRLISMPRRYGSVGEKRNAIAGMVSPGVEAIAQWDDDDFYFPWALGACAHALRNAAWARPSQALEWCGPDCYIKADTFGLSRHRTSWLAQPQTIDYGGQWSFRLKEFLEFGGYDYRGNGEDVVLSKQFYTRHGQSADTICQEYPDPFYIYSRTVSGTYHTSDEGSANTGYEKLGAMGHPFCPEIKIGWLRDYLAIPFPQEVKPRPWGPEWEEYLRQHP